MRSEDAMSNMVTIADHTAAQEKFAKRVGLQWGGREREKERDVR